MSFSSSCVRRICSSSSTSSEISSCQKIYPPVMGCPCSRVVRSSVTVLPTACCICASVSGCAPADARTGTKRLSVISPLTGDTAKKSLYPVLDCISPHWMHASNAAVKVRHCTTVISPAILRSHGSCKMYKTPYTTAAPMGTNGSHRK